MKSRAKDWLRQAENDLSWAFSSLKDGFYAPVCFVGQQIAEKALKSIALARGALEIRSHSLVQLASALGIDGDLEMMGKRLDMYYITARYPDAFAEGAPFEYFVESQAREALGFAQAFIDRARAEIAERA